MARKPNPSIEVLDAKKPRKKNPIPKYPDMIRAVGDVVRTRDNIYEKTGKNTIVANSLLAGQGGEVLSVYALGDWVRYNRQPMTVYGYIPFINSRGPVGVIYVLKDSGGKIIVSKATTLSGKHPEPLSPAPKTKRQGNPFVDDGKISRIKKSLREVLLDLEESSVYDVTPISPQPRRQIPSSTTRPIDFLEDEDKTAEFFYGPAPLPLPSQRLLPAPAVSSKKKPGRPKKQTESVPTEKRKPGRPKKQTESVPTEKRKPGRPKKQK